MVYTIKTVSSITHRAGLQPRYGIVWRGILATGPLYSRVHKRRFMTVISNAYNVPILVCKTRKTT